jgi:hypothetical protein
MNQLFFYSCVVVANVWIAASYATEKSSKALYGIGVGLFWLFLAMISELFS